MTVQELQTRAPTLRARILKMINAAHTGHPGGSLSAIDIMQAIMKWGSFNPTSEVKDWFVLGKGHAVPALYSILAELGYLEESELLTYRKVGSRLQGHPDRNKLPCIQANTGHLGQGLSIGVGLAMAEKHLNTFKKVFVLIGNGDLNEGQTWEAVQSAAKYGLSNLIVFVDDNKITQHGWADQIMNVNPIEKKFSDFGWLAKRINGHDYTELLQSLNALNNPLDTKKPRAFICDTIKGKGVGFMENEKHWHSTDLPDELLQKALGELGFALKGEAL